MNKTPQDWLLERDGDALPRLDSLRRGVLAPERATLPEAVAEIFRPNLGVWASLAVVWLVLLAAHLRISAGAATGLTGAGPRADMALVALPNDEKISLLDTRP